MRSVPFLFLFFLINCNLQGADSTPISSEKEEKIHFTYSVSIEAIPSDASDIRVFLPLPKTDKIQGLEGLVFNIPYPYEEKRERAHGNRYVEIQLNEAPIPSKIEFNVQGVITRQAIEDTSLYRKDTTGLQQALLPDSLIPFDERIKSEAKKAIPQSNGPVKTAKAYHDHLINSMKYDKSGTGWGKGDAIHACTSKEGNCTDFHSLFIGMSRIREIPARFHIGFMIPPGEKGAISGYHCWAEFHDGAKWIPLDISEAWKDPDKKEYYFGNLDAHRIRFTTGRDIPLTVAPGRIQYLNYFIYPHAYADGEELKQSLDWEFSFERVE